MALCSLSCFVARAAKKASSCFLARAAKNAAKKASSCLVVHAAKKASSCLIVHAAKKASKKFGGGDGERPMAKRLQIADENRGSLPNAKKSDDLGDGMREASKKFGGGDGERPMAKRLLIADENRGSLLNAKKSEDLGDGMRAPGLVARLMGLESMPVVAHEKPKNRENARSRGGSGFPGLDEGRYRCPEMGGLRKLESRPQKLQKTGGFLERRSTSIGSTSIGRPGSSRSRKQHQKTGGFLERRSTSIGRPGPDGFSKSVIINRIDLVDEPVIDLCGCCWLPL